MSNADLTDILLIFLMLVGLAQLFGYLFVKMHQPRVVGEIMAGILLGPSLLGRVHFAAKVSTAIGHEDRILNLFYWLGLLLLMFVSGTEARQLFGRDEQREVLWLTVVGTGFPMVLGLVFGPLLIRPALMGPNGNNISLTIILAVGVAVTSVPVISKIFTDLKIIQTRFARVVLGVAVLEDIILWLALAISTSLAGNSRLHLGDMSIHLVVTVAFFVLGLTLVPRAIKRANKSRFNIVARHSPTAYVITVLLAYCVLAGLLDISMVFAAFLAGFAVVHKKRQLFADSIKTIADFSFAVFIPIYFAVVGLKLNLSRGFSLSMIGVFLLVSCTVKILSIALAGRFAGFRGLELINLAVTTNARGGPGIVLASVAFDAGIISSKFYTTLVIAAVLTSQIAGAWLEYVLRKGWPLLRPESASTATASVQGKDSPARVASGLGQIMD